MNSSTKSDGKKANTYNVLKSLYGNTVRFTFYRRAIKKYGESSRLNLAIEEMSELIKELCKHVRGENRFDTIAEEMADVEIMLEQLKILFNNTEHVQEWKERKLRRLADLIDQNSD